MRWALACIAAVVLAAALPGCTQSGAPSPTTSTGPTALAVRELDCPRGGTPPPAGTEVIGEPTEWPSAWRRMCGSDGELPPVDFKRDLVVVYSWGARSGSDEVLLRNATVVDGVLHLAVSHAASACPTKDLAFAGLVLVMDRFAFATLEVDAVDEVRPCGTPTSAS